MVLADSVEVFADFAAAFVGVVVGSAVGVADSVEVFADFGMVLIVGVLVGFVVAFAAGSAVGVADFVVACFVVAVDFVKVVAGFAVFLGSSATDYSLQDIPCRVFGIIRMLD